MPRALLCDLAQAWTADRYRQAHRDAPAGARARPAFPPPVAPAGSRPWQRPPARRAGRWQPMTGKPPPRHATVQDTHPVEEGAILVTAGSG